MTEALLLNMSLGLLWAILGVLMSSVASGKDSIFAFYAVGTGLAALGSWIIAPDWSVLLQGDIPRCRALVLSMISAGAMNACAQGLFVSALRRGHKAVTWAMGQSAMVVPFAASILYWGERVRWCGYVGIVLIVVMLIFLSRKMDSEAPRVRSRAWLPLVILTFSAVGTAQVLYGIPSRWMHWEDVGRIRLPVSLTATALVHLVVMSLSKARPNRRSIKLSAVFAVVAIVSFLVVFHCLDRMTAFGLQAIVFPLGIGIAIAAFSIYSSVRLKERFSVYTAVGLLSGLTGIGLIAFA